MCWAGNGSHRLPLACKFGHPFIWGPPNLLDVSFEGPLTCWMSVFRGTLTCLHVMWSLFWPKLDLKMKIWPTSGCFGENCLLKFVFVCLILTQWWNKKMTLLPLLKIRLVSSIMLYPQAVWLRRRSTITGTTSDNSRMSRVRESARKGLPELGVQGSGHTKSKTRNATAKLQCKGEGQHLMMCLVLWNAPLTIDEDEFQVPQSSMFI